VGGGRPGPMSHDFDLFVKKPFRLLVTGHASLLRKGEGRCGPSRSPKRSPWMSNLGHVGWKPPRVVIADEDAPTRVGVRLALERNGFVVSAEEDTGPGAVAAALRDPPDLCLLAVSMPGGGVEAAAEICLQLPQTQVVVLSSASDDDELFAALEAGASGYLLKGMNPARLGPTLTGVLRGEAALPRSLTSHLIAEFRGRARHGPSGLVRRSENDLSAREWEVLDCLGEGLSTKRIAKRLFITPTTVRRHVGSILKKLDVPSREAAVKLAAQRSENLNAG
jgi:two-component system, NarL family, nitrate/nitrite response regulator NarL